MTGVINGHELGAATLNTSVQQEARSGVTTIRSSISHIPTSVGKWGPAPGDPPAHARPRWRPSLHSEACSGLIPKGNPATPCKTESLLESD